MIYTHDIYFIAHVRNLRLASFAPIYSRPLACWLKLNIFMQTTRDKSYLANDEDNE